MLKYYKTIKECCQYLDIIYKKNYTVSNNYTVSKNTEKIFFVKRNSKKDVKEDGKTYTFHLRKDAKWSDGSPVTAKDFEYSWRRICDPDFASEALQAITDYVVGATEYFEGTGEYGLMSRKSTN